MAFAGWSLGLGLGFRIDRIRATRVSGLGFMVASSFGRKLQEVQGHETGQHLAL